MELCAVRNVHVLNIETGTHILFVWHQSFIFNTDKPIVLFPQNNFCEFIWRVVEQCQHSTLYDEYMLATLIAWTVGFTDSQVRAFRHTSSLAGVKLVSALVTIANSVNSDIDNTQVTLCMRTYMYKFTLFCSH